MNNDNNGKTQLYAMSRSLIAEVGASEAYILTKFCFLQGKSKNIIDGKHWFYAPMEGTATGPKSKRTDRNGKLTYRPLINNFPWLSASAFRRMVRKLEANPKKQPKPHWKPNLTIRNLNTFGSDRTLWYHVPEKVYDSVKATKKKDMRWFNPAEAVALGINAALVLNLIYRDFHRKKGSTHIILSRRQISKDIGLPLSTVNDVFKKLQEANYMDSYDDGLSFKLIKTNPCTMKGNGKGRKSVSKKAAVVELEQDHYASVQSLLWGKEKPKQAKENTFMLDAKILKEFYVAALERERQAKLNPVEKVTPKRRRRGSAPVADALITSTRGYHSDKRAENVAERSYLVQQKRAKGRAVQVKEKNRRELALAS